MKTIRKTLALILVLSMILAISASAFAEEDEVLYVNFGDSIAWGRIENEENFPEYDWENDSYSGLFAAKLGTERVSYARRGMQTTDVLYMIDGAYQAAVDNGIINPDSWHQREYPPYDGTSLDEVRSTTAAADYISLCIGICDYISYPGDVKSAAMEEVPDTDELSAQIKEYFGNGTIDKEAFELLSEILNANGEKAKITVKYVLDMLKGYADYVINYPLIVKDLRSLNKTGTIILMGNYLPGGSLSFLIETEDSSKLIALLNRLLDNINLVAKTAAIEYGCVYVDTMGVESDWHPTVKGHQQICDRIVSVLSGDKTYAGGIIVCSAVKDRFLQDIHADVEPADVNGLFGKLFASLRAFIGRILSLMTKGFKG